MVTYVTPNHNIYGGTVAWIYGPVGAFDTPMHRATIIILEVCSACVPSHTPHSGADTIGPLVPVKVAHHWHQPVSKNSLVCFIEVYVYQQSQVSMRIMTVNE